MAKVIDLGARRELLQHQRKDTRTTELKEALRTARTDCEGGNEGDGESDRKARATSNLLKLYKRKNPPETR